MNLRGSVHWECAVWESAHWGANFFNRSIRNNQKSSVQHVIKIDKSQMTLDKIPSEGKLLPTAEYPLPNTNAYT